MDPTTTTTTTVTMKNHARVMESVRRGMSNASTRVSNNAKIVAATYNTASELHEKNRENEKQIVSLKRELVELQDDRAKTESDMLTRLAELHAEKVAMEEELGAKLREGEGRIEELLEERRMQKQGGKRGGLFRRGKKRGGVRDKSQTIDENGNADAESSVADDDEASSTAATETSEKDGTNPNPVRGCNSFESDYDATYDCRAIAPSPSHGSYDSSATATTFGTEASYNYHLEQHRQNHGVGGAQSERARSVLASLERLRVAIGAGDATVTSELDFLEGEVLALVREAADDPARRPQSSEDPAASPLGGGLQEGEEEATVDDAAANSAPWYAEVDDEEESASTSSSPSGVSPDGNDRDAAADDPVAADDDEGDEATDSKTKKKKKKVGVKKGIGRAFGGSSRTRKGSKLVPSSSKSKLTG